MTPFGAKLRQMRKSKGVSLKEMASGIGVSSAYLSALEHGHRGTPTWAMVQRIISYFNVIWDDAEELQSLVEFSNPRMTIDTSGMDVKATELANRLARDIGELNASALDDLLMALAKAKASSRAN